MGCIIEIDGKTFTSMRAGARFLGQKNSYGLAYALNKSKKHIYRGHHVRLIKPSRNLKGGAKCPVRCETLEITFPSIQSAARHANANSWTMGKKMDVLGKFIDDKGNVYTRTKPMVTKNKYVERKPTVNTAYFHTKEPRKTKVVKSIEGTFTVTALDMKLFPIQNKSDLETFKVALKSYLKDNVIKCLQEDNSEMVRELINFLEKMDK